MKWPARPRSAAKPFAREDVGGKTAGVDVVIAKPKALGLEPRESIGEVDGDRIHQPLAVRDGDASVASIRRSAPKTMPGVAAGAGNQAQSAGGDRSRLARTVESRSWAWRQPWAAASNTAVDQRPPIRAAISGPRQRVDRAPGSSVARKRTTRDSRSSSGVSTTP